jgi:NhaP-type Na+/H+ or K+/H+ antiporter
LCAFAWRLWNRYFLPLMGWALAVIAAVIVAYALVSNWLDRTPITAAIFFLSCGLLFGNKGVGWIDLGIRSEPVRILAESTLTLVLYVDASRIDISALRREYRVPLRLLGLGLPLTILAGWALAAGLFSNLSLGEALLLAIILAPTDAALGQTVVTEPSLPSRIRQGLNVESGLNDGICVPLLFIALAISDSEAHTTSTHGAIVLVVEAIGYGVLFGVLAGTVGALLLRLAREYGLAEPSWIQVVPVGTAALSYGLAAPLGGSGFLAAFVAGFTFGAVRRGGDELATCSKNSVNGQSSNLRRLRRGGRRARPGRHDLDGRALRGTQPDRRSNAPRRRRARRHSRPHADGRVHGLVRTARPRVDRLYRHRP